MIRGERADELVADARARGALSARAASVLVRVDATTKRQASFVSDDLLLAFKNCGRVTVDEIRRWTGPPMRPLQRALTPRERQILRRAGSHVRAFRTPLAEFDDVDFRIACRGRRADIAFLKSWRGALL